MPSNDGDGGGCTGGPEAATSTGGEGGEGREAAQPRLHPRDQVWQRLDLSLLLLPQQPAPRETRLLTNTGGGFGSGSLARCQGGVWLCHRPSTSPTGSSRCSS
jgi:hypothetical protein